MSSIKSLLRPLYLPIYLPLLREQKFRQRQKLLRQQCRAQQKKVLLIIGSGETHFDGWISTDLPYLDILNRRHWKYLFAPASIDRILAEHVFEHLTIEQFQSFLHLVRPYLAVHAMIRLAVPDGYHPDPAYIEHVRPGGSGAGAEDHKVLYTCDLISKTIADVHYDYRLLEYFDAQGNFHQNEWNPDDGMVRRSAQYDQRNQDRPLAFTSLMVDLWPC